MRPTRTRDNIMKKRVLLVYAIAVLAALFTNIPLSPAQDCFHESKERPINLGQSYLDNMSAPMKTDMGKYSVGLQIPHNIMVGYDNSLKMGIGARFTYDFTKMLRISIDADYYLLKPDNTKIEDLGEQWDANFNFNFVFGERDFHIYFLVGGGLTYFVDYDNWYNSVVLSVDKSFQGMVNLGLGIEYQLNEKFRLYYEPALTVSIGSLYIYNQWYMCKLGLSYCF
ncbi:MAG: hypothetical protein AUK63_1851 [bacterium P3]|nr:MAG: hypothetical protein AUK63_1851 [bacterium P3]KWW35871.1 MAG: hypothetical protein F083_2361 [bacterium F083]